MTKSNKILLKSLLKIEFELGKTQKILENNNLCFYFHFDFNKLYDLFEIIISAFDISESNYDFLYDLLNSLYNNNISVDEAIATIENLVKSSF